MGNCTGVNQSRKNTGSMSKNADLKAWKQQGLSDHSLWKKILIFSFDRPGYSFL